MRLLVSLALVAASGACHRDIDMYPIGTGGPGHGGSTTPDSAVADSIGEGTAITGRVCLIDDARAPTTCASSGAAGLTVALGEAMTATADDGSFTIVAGSGTNLVWRVTGADIQSAAMQVSATATIPAISSSLFEDMVTTNQAISGDGTGSVIARLTMGSAGVSGLIATTTPAAEGAIYYDGTTAITWDTTSTGSFGVVWVPGVAAGSAELSLSGSHTATVTGIPVYADTVTFVFASIQ